MSGLVDQIMSSLSSDQVNAIAARIGVDPSQTRTAIEHALPLIVGHVAQNASSPQGAENLQNVLAEHQGFNISDVLSGVLGNSGTGVGGAILGHIFGTNQTAASQGLGQATGIGQQNSATLLAILAPIVMSALANHAASQGLNAGGLGGMLAGEAQQIQQRGGVAGGLLSAVLSHSGGNFDLSNALGGLLGSFGRH